MSNSIQSMLVSSLSRVFRPLVRLLIHFQITHPYVSQLLKQVYLDVAKAEYQVEGKKLTDSRLSLLTGIHRKDVRAWREQENQLPIKERTRSLGAQVVAAWTSDPEYLDEQGNARPLALSPKEQEVNFESLVTSVSKQDLKARSLLDEWLRTGMVRVDDSNLVHLLKEAYIPDNSLEEKVVFFEKGQQAHLESSVGNLIGEKAPQFDRLVYYGGLSGDSIQQLKKYMDLKGMALLKDFNQRARELQKKDKLKDETKHRIVVGAYVHHQGPDEGKVSHE
ncbi:MAG: DUF6502 family protein [Gammaproteobacteria bacterium]|nr:DUF6502 family protein [Gammaproteobacteria bacterium]MDH5694576.1 DUF6502 family protein [Gammaproteobacteria bacterium]